MRWLRSQLHGFLHVLVLSLILGVSATPDALAWMQLEPEFESAHLHEGQHDQLRTVLSVEDGLASATASRVPWWQNAPTPQAATPRVSARGVPSRSPFRSEHGAALKLRARARADSRLEVSLRPEVTTRRRAPSTPFLPCVDPARRRAWSGWILRPDRGFGEDP